MKYIKPTTEVQLVKADNILVVSNIVKGEDYTGGTVQGDAKDMFIDIDDEWEEDF